MPDCERGWNTFNPIISACLALYPWGRGSSGSISQNDSCTTGSSPGNDYEAGSYHCPVVPRVKAWHAVAVATDTRVACVANSASGPYVSFGAGDAASSLGEAGLQQLGNGLSPACQSLVRPRKRRCCRPGSGENVIQSHVARLGRGARVHRCSRRQVHPRAAIDIDVRLQVPWRPPEPVVHREGARCALHTPAGARHAPGSVWVSKRALRALRTERSGGHEAGRAGLAAQGALAVRLWLRSRSTLSACGLLVATRRDWNLAGCASLTGCGARHACNRVSLALSTRCRAEVARETALCAGRAGSATGAAGKAADWAGCADSARGHSPWRARCTF